MMKPIVLDDLPHGSGINGEWTSDETKTSVRLHNVFDIVNDVGMYVAYVPFTVIVPKTGDPVEGFRLVFRCVGNEGYWVRKTGLRAYLDEMFAEHIRSLC